VAGGYMLHMWDIKL